MIWIPFYKTKVDNALQQHTKCGPAANKNFKLFLRKHTQNVYSMDHGPQQQLF